MSPLKLHTKTTLLASAITLGMVLAMLLLASLRMVDLVRDDEKELARLQALSVAEQISLMPEPRDQEDLSRAVSQARGARRNVIVVRFWELDGERLVERAASTNGPPPEEIPIRLTTMLRNGTRARSIDDLPTYSLEERNGIRYRVFAPVTE